MGQLHQEREHRLSEVKSRCQLVVQLSNEGLKSLVGVLKGAEVPICGEHVNCVGMRRLHDRKRAMNDSAGEYTSELRCILSREAWWGSDANKFLSVVTEEV